MAKKSLEDSAVFKLTEEQVWLAERAPKGFLVALWLDPETASKLAIKGGESADSLHITIAYCGDAEEMGGVLQARAITAVADAVCYWSQPSGTISGYGRFNASESSDGKDVFYATPDIPQLAYLRERIVSCLSDQGVAVAQNHGYTPHITLSYLDSDAENPVDKIDDLDLKFSSTTIMIGDQRIDIPFWTEIEATIAMSDSADPLPVEASLEIHAVRSLFGDFSKDWIPFLPKPGVYTHTAYGDMNLTSETYQQMLDNFNNRVFKQDLPIRATHMPSDGGAIGWIMPGGMRLAEDGSLEVKPTWNELGQGLIDGDRFRNVSAEYCKEWTNPVTLERIKNVAVGLALVPRPHFKTDVLRPLSASEALAFAEMNLSSVELDDKQEGTTVTEEEKKAAAEAAEAATKKLAEDAALAATAATALIAEKKLEPFIPSGQIILNDLQQVIMTAEQREKERIMFQDLSDRVTLAERRAVNAEAETERMRNERRKEKFTAEVTGHSAENGVAWFGSIEANVKQLISLAQSHGDDSTEVRWTIEQKRNEANAIRNTGLFKPLSLSQTGDSESSILAQVQHLADQLRVAEPTLSIEQAMNRVYQENPEFYTRGLGKK